jgi:Zn-finger nucleic acid-binding protein
MLVECSTCHARYDASGRAVGSLFRCRCGAELSVPRPTPWAGALDCPRCGAPASPDSATCAYCQAALALVGCPRCLGRVFSGARYCQHCGAPLDVPAVPVGEASREVPCPRCPEGALARLASRQLGATRLLECPRCGGTWLDAHTVMGLVSEHDQQAALATALPGLAASAGAPQKAREGEVRYLKCPECARLMNRENFGRRSGVVVDSCRAHGVWFDSGELGEVVGFVMRGGLDEARKRELEEAKQELRRRHEELDRGGDTSPLSAAFPNARQGAGVSLLDLVFNVLR